MTAATTPARRPKFKPARRAPASGPFGGAKSGRSGVGAGAGGRVCLGVGARTAPGSRAGGGEARRLSVGCPRGPGPSWQREVPGSWSQDAGDQQEPNFWAAEVVLPAERRVPVLGTARAGGFNAGAPRNGSSPPPAWLCAGAARREGGSLGPRSGAGGKEGQMWSPVLGGGLWVGLQHPPLARSGSPRNRNLADKDLPEGLQKVISRPSRRPLARLPQRGRFVLGPCNPSPGTAPQRRLCCGWDRGRRQVSALAAGCPRTPPACTPVLESSPRAGWAFPRDGEGRCGATGSPPSGSGGVSPPHLAGPTSPALAKGGTWAGKEAG